MIQGPNVATGVFALGTALFEVSSAEPPYYSKINPTIGENRRLYAAGGFPNVERLILGKSRNAGEGKYCRRRFQLEAF